VVALEGLPSVGPKQVPIPDAWRALPTDHIKAGQSLKINESRRSSISRASPVDAARLRLNDGRTR
jgi:hypothetical protein